MKTCRSALILLLILLPPMLWGQEDARWTMAFWNRPRASGLSQDIQDDSGNGESGAGGNGGGGERPGAE